MVHCTIAPLHDAETSFQRLFFSMLEFKSLQHIFFCKYVISIKYVFLISLLVIFTLLILHAWSDICYLLAVKDLLMILLSRDDLGGIDFLDIIICLLLETSSENWYKCQYLHTLFVTAQILSHTLEDKIMSTPPLPKKIRF